MFFGSDLLDDQDWYSGALARDVNSRYSLGDIIPEAKAPSYQKCPPGFPRPWTTQGDNSSVTTQSKFPEPAPNPSPTTGGSPISPIGEAPLPDTTSASPQMFACYSFTLVLATVSAVAFVRHSVETLNKWTVVTREPDAKNAETMKIEGKRLFYFWHSNNNRDSIQKVVYRERQLPFSHGRIFIVKSAHDDVNGFSKNRHSTINVGLVESGRNG
jgi:hypothetical protein